MILILRVQVLRVHGDAGDEAAAADRHEDGVELAARLAQDLDRDGALPRDHVRIVEGMHERQIALAHDGLRVFVGAVVVVAMQHHFATEVAHRAHLDVRRGLRHHDDRGDAAALAASATPCAWLPADAQMTPRLRDRVRQVRDLVVGAAQLEREHRLQVLALQQHAYCRCGATGAAPVPAAIPWRRRRRGRGGCVRYSCRSWDA